jgi:hypothetical protein
VGTPGVPLPHPLLAEAPDHLPAEGHVLMGHPFKHGPDAHCRLTRGEDHLLAGGSGLSGPFEQRREAQRIGALLPGLIEDEELRMSVGKPRATSSILRRARTRNNLL